MGIKNQNGHLPLRTSSMPGLWNLALLIASERILALRLVGVGQVIEVHIYIYININIDMITILYIFINTAFTYTYV